MKILKSILVLGAVLALLVGCTNNAQKVEEEGALVKASAKQFRDSIKDNDLEKFAGTLMDDVKLTRPDGTVFDGFEQAKEWFVGAHSNFDIVVEMFPEKGLVTPAKKTAWGYGQYRLTRTNTETGESQQEDGWYRTFWQKQSDGVWKLHRFDWMNHETESRDENKM